MQYCADQAPERMPCSGNPEDRPGSVTTMYDAAADSDNPMPQQWQTCQTPIPSHVAPMTQKSLTVVQRGAPDLNVA
jgi:hypothetical protein